MRKGNPKNRNGLRLNFVWYHNDIADCLCLLRGKPLAIDGLELCYDAEEQLQTRMSWESAGFNPGSRRNLCVTVVNLPHSIFTLDDKTVIVKMALF